MECKKQLNRALIATDAICNGLKKSKRAEKSSKRILIIFQQIFGDALVFSSALQAYPQLYHKTEGYEITFLARPSVIAFMKDIVPIHEDIHVDAVDFKRIVEDYGYYKQVIKKYRNYADIIIVPGSSLSAEILSSACNARRKIGLVRSIPVKWPPVMSLFYRLAYTESVIPNKESMMLQRHRQLLQYLGVKGYQAVLPVLLDKKKIIAEDHYIVVCPGSSKMEKCWPTERFVEVIDYMIEAYGMNIHLCGGSDELKFERQILEEARNKKHIISHIGDTNFSDWSAIVQHADLVLGNDSATLHLAAAGRVPSICIAGIYDKFQFFPYRVDLLEATDRLPVTIYKDMPCEWCRTIGYHSGYGNKVCKERIDKNKCSLCINSITTDEVITKVDELLS